MEESRKDPPLEKIAYHEAGHAVIAHLFGIGMKSVSIEPDLKEDTLGNVLRNEEDFKNLKFSQIQERAIHEFGAYVLFAMAGFLSVHIYNGEPEQMDIGLNNFRDVLSLSDYRETLQGTELEQDQLMDDCQKTALDCLRTNWQAVRALAISLLEKKTIEGPEVARIIEANRAFNP